MENLRPIEEVSYTDTHGTIFQYAAAGVSVDVSQNDVTGECVILYQTHYGQRWLVRDFERTKKLIGLVQARYPVKPFQCAVDY